MREIVRPLYDVLPANDEPSDGMSFASYGLNDVAVNRATFDRYRLARGARHLRKGETDHIAVRLYVRGRTTAVCGDLPVVMVAGSVTLFDRRYAMHGLAEPGLVYGCLLPRHKIDTSVFNRAPAITWPVTSPQGQLLSNALLTTWRALPRTRAADAEALAAGLIGLVNGLLPAQVRQEALPDEATLAAMQSFIERHLHEPDLDAAALCRTFACSRARLYRLFRPCGGVERHIRDRRLQRCLNELTRAHPSARRVGAVAAAWGFDDPSHFHRLFTARFAITPSDALALGRDLSRQPAAPVFAGHSADLEQLHGWLSRI